MAGETAGRRRRMGWAGWTLAILAGLALVLFGTWRWAVASQSVAMLDWIDARFAREVPAIKLAEAQYGKHPQQRLEVYRAESVATIGPAGPNDTAPQQFSLVVFIHGGGWRSGDPRDYRFVARAFADRGYATALVGYRLDQPGRYPAMLEDGAAALRWLTDNAARLNLRADRIYLVGHSAGAYNAVMLALDPRWLAGEGLPPETIRGVVGLAGPYDFYPFDTEGTKLAFGHVATPGETQPVNYANAGGPPLLLLTGSDDTSVRPRNTRALHAAIQEAGGLSRAVEFDGMSHAGIIMALARPFDRDSQVMDEIIPFFGNLGLGFPSAAVQGPQR